MDRKLRPAQRYPSHVHDSFRRQCLLARSGRIKVVWLTITFSFALMVQYISTSANQSQDRPVSDIAAVQKCTISNLRKHQDFLHGVVPIEVKEFHQRRDRLAAALYDSGVDAYVLEPGYTFQYYGNISQVDWEPWEPEERPFLMVVQPVIDEISGAVTANTTFLAPHFEEGRVRMLGMPFLGTEELVIAIWEEHWNPYEILRSTIFNNASGVKVMVDEEMRDYIVRGLDAAGFQTLGLNTKVDNVRQMKSPAEIELIRAVNTGTVEAVRQMRPCLVPGLTENEVTSILDNALQSLGFSLFFNVSHSTQQVP